MAICTAEELTSVIGQLTGNDKNVIRECLAICHNFSISPEDLRWKLEAVTFNSTATHSEISSVTLDSISALKAQMQRELTQKKVLSKPTAVPANTSRLRRHILMPGVNAAPVPAILAGRNVVKQEDIDIRIPGPSRVVFSGQDDKQQRVYRYMFEKQMERSESMFLCNQQSSSRARDAEDGYEELDQMIDDAAERVRKHYRIEDIGDPGISTDDDIVIVGRIFQDIETDSKLMESSVFIESSRMLSGGSRVALKFDVHLVIRNNISDARGIGLFPGAIVAMKGRNGGGGYFLVKEILTLPVSTRAIAPSASNAMKVDPVYSSAFSLAIACGPFTPDSDLTYAPFANMVEALQKDKPSALLLVGPFVDAVHPAIKAGNLDMTPDKLFQRRIYESLKTFLVSSPDSIVILLPGIRDLISQHAVYPQGELSSDLIQNDSRIYLVPNPARFKINDVTFGASSVDVLFHLRREEFTRTGREEDPMPLAHGNDVGTDAMANLCRHLIQQRSFYPIFPTPQDLAHEVNLDISHSDGLKLMDEENSTSPDVLILPSRLKQFVKTVYTTTVINPSTLNRGTYAVLNVAEGANAIDIRQRLSCEINRLAK